jgi:TM2 domain-containing membrane protein YozV
MKRLIFSLFVLTTILFATVTVDGYAYLENQSDHSGINVIFKSHDTGTVSDSVTTEENGYFTVQVETNNYFITYEKDGYFSEDIKPRGTIEFEANTTLSSITLLKRTKLIKFANFIENKVVDNYQKLNFPQKILEKIQLADTTSQTPPARHHQSDTSQPPASEPAIRFSKNAAPPETTGEAGASDQPPASNLATRFSKNTASSDTSDKAGASDQPRASNLATRFSKNTAPSDTSDKAGASDQPPASNLATRFSKNAAPSETTGEAGASDQPDTSQSLASESVIRFSKNTDPPEMTEKAGASDQPPASNLATRFSKNTASSDTSDKVEANDQPLASNPATRFSKNAFSPGAPGKTGPDPQQTITTKYRSIRKPPTKTKMGAMVRSLLFPGLGQFYANQRMWGYGWIAAEVVAGGLIVMNYSNYKTAYDDYNDYHTSYTNATDPVLIAHYKTQTQNSHENLEFAMDDMKTMASIAGVVWIANAVHAYIVGPTSGETAYNKIPLQLAYDQNTDQFKLSVSIPLD